MLKTLLATLIEANQQLTRQLQQRTEELEQTQTHLQAEIRRHEETETVLKTREAQLRQIFEYSNDAIFVLDPEGDRILEANQRAVQHLQYSREELLSSVRISMVHPHELDKMIAFSQSVLEQGHGWTNELACRTKQGTLVPGEVSASVIEYDGRRCVLALVRDITERKQAEQAQARLAEIGELAAMIVHEVRNPLTTVLMGLNSFQKLELPNSAQQRLELALEEAERLKRLLNEILLYARPQTLQTTRIELNHLSQALLTSLQELPVAQSRPITFLSSLSSVWVLGDPDKLKQVFVNLLRNACEAIESGDTVTWRIQPGMMPCQVQISVQNYGNLIPPELINQIGTPFFTTKPSGNGLGLAIVKQIVQAHRGELFITSDPDQGTIVSIQLPTLENVENVSSPQI
ncbi:two-component system sensor histidine kinase NtrB [Egbenema bharatensis]|uniref:two-component system sensor histidine kinase NtrB n=1 Tax=Egbenema bharatensis TaxID=3463334 RepID=UPI003A8990E7